MAEPAYLSFYLGSNTVYVFCSVLHRMGRPPYVRFLINPNTMQLVMQPYHKKEFTSFRVPKAIYENLPGRHAARKTRQLSDLQQGVLPAACCENGVEHRQILPYSRHGLYKILNGPF